MNKWFSSFHWQTSLMTLLAIPLAVIIFKTLRKYLIGWVKLLLEGLLYNVSKYINHTIAASLSMSRYCKLQYANEKYRKLHVPSRFEVSLDIDSVYVNLTLSNNQSAEDTPISLRELQYPGRRIKIMGDPGSGKSTLIKKVFRNGLQAGMYTPRSLPLPILLELKNLTPPDMAPNEAGKWLYDYLKEEAAKNEVYEMANCVDSYARKSGLLVLLDGLDEVASTHYRAVEKAINGLSQYLYELSEHNSILLTVRTQYYQQIKSDYFHSFPDAIFLNPFSPSDIYDFLSRWPIKHDRTTHIDRIYKALTDRPTLREMCSNPLVLSMYVAEDQASGGNLSPESRTEFYKKVTDELILLRRQQQNKQTGKHITSLKEQRERILGQIAYRHLMDIEQPKNMLRWQDAIAVIQDVMQCDAVEAATVFDDIAKETGLITEERFQETFRFIHLTFCEFLAAYEATQGVQDGWAGLMEKHRYFSSAQRDDRSRLLEVIPFAAGLLPRIYRGKALDDVNQLNDPPLMARCFLETKLYDHPSWPAFVAGTSESIKASMPHLNEQWLMNLHIFNVVITDADAVSKHLPVPPTINLHRFYEALLDKQKDSFKKILAAYALQDAAAVFRLAELSHLNLLDEFPELLIDSCDQNPFLGLVLEKIMHANKAESEKWAVVLSEAALRKSLNGSFLNLHPPAENLARYLKDNPRYRNWARKPGQHSLLTQCLSLASGKTWPPVTYPLLFIFSHLKTPAELRIRLLLVKIVYALFQGALLVLVLMGLVSFIPLFNKIQAPVNWIPYYVMIFLLEFGHSVIILNKNIRNFLDRQYNTHFMIYAYKPNFYTAWLHRWLFGLFTLETLLLMENMREDGIYSFNGLAGEHFQEFFKKAQRTVSRLG